jgi:PAS domain S-box-containing protein
MRKKPLPTGREVTFGEEEIIVSKTDPNGRITYANDVFLRVSGYSEAEVIAQPHSMIRHPDMPRCVFQLLWSTIQRGQEIFAYVVNMAKSGDHYWVFAHVTPTLGPDGSIVGFHSNRRWADPRALAKVVPLYRAVVDEERRAPSKPEAMMRSHALLTSILEREGVGYERFVFAL